jgi:signal transduction histidine kinase
LSESIPTAPAGPPSTGPDPLAVRADKLELLERLSDALAHEIKNPLHSMVINLEVLKRRLARAPDGGGDALRYAVVLGDELDRVTLRVELLLRLARPDRRGPEVTTLAEIADEVMELVHLEARHRELEVRFTSSGPAVPVRVARQRARQIVLDLILDAMDEAAAGATLAVEVVGHETTAELRVTGDGPGGTERLAIAAALAEAAGGRVVHDDRVRALVLPRARSS